MTRWVALALCGSLCSCGGAASVGGFPTFSESQNEWLQSHCDVTFVGEVSATMTVADARQKLHADVVERFACSDTTVQVAAYRCREPVPLEVAQGEH